MGKLKLDLFWCLLWILMAFLSISIFKLVKNRLGADDSILSTARKNLRPNRRNTADPSAVRKDLRPDRRNTADKEEAGQESEKEENTEKEKPKGIKKLLQPLANFIEKLFQPLVNIIRKLVVDPIQRWFQSLGSNYAVYGDVLRRCTRRENVIATISEMVLVIGASIGMAFFCNYSIGGVDLYLTTFMTLVYVLLVVVLFARCVDGARGIYLPCCVMILCGIALATLLYLSPMRAVAANHIGKPDETVGFQKIALVLGLLAFPMVRMACRSGKRGGWIFLLNVAIFGLYGALFVFGKEINGARNWISLGGYSFQVSEVTKVLTVAAMALTLTAESWSEEKRFVWATATMAVNGGFLLICNEFGTLLVLCVVYVCLCLVYQTKLKGLICVIILFSILAGIFLAVAHRCYDLTPKKAPMAAPVTAATEKKPSFDKHHEYTEVELWEPVEKEDKPAEETELYIKVGGYYKKFQDRFLVFLDSEAVDPNKEGYQWKMAREALVISDWMGSPYDVAVPVARSDFIFSYLIVRLGMLFGFGILLLLAVMACVGTIRSLQNIWPGEAAVSFGFVMAMVSQSLIAAASATGNFAIVGIPFAFLAYGGSATMMNYVMMFFVIYATRREKLVGDRPVISNREGGA